MEIGTLADLRLAIIEGDKKFLSSATGVGGKLAERISLELKDKLRQMDKGPAAAGAAESGDEALAALQFLGLNRQQAQQALDGVDEKLATEERVKRALQRGKLE